MIKKILVATDGSDHARKTIELASDIALKYNAKIYLIHVVNEPKIPEGIVEWMREEHVRESPSYVYLQTAGRGIIEAAEREIRAKGLKEVESALDEGDPATRIIKFAKENGVDVIMMGSHGIGGVESLFLGSVSHKVCHLAHCTCVTVK